MKNRDFYGESDSSMFTLDRFMDKADYGLFFARNAAGKWNSPAIRIYLPSSRNQAYGGWKEITLCGPKNGRIASPSRSWWLLDGASDQQGWAGGDPAEAADES